MGDDFMGMKKRSGILMFSLHFEAAVTTTLIKLLEVDAKKNISFSSSRALTFEAKVALLLDLNVIEDPDKLKISHFMAIRNKFLHLIDIDTYDKCVSKISGLKNYLEKNYKFDPDKDLEYNLQAAIYKLGSECSEINLMMYHKILLNVENKTRKELEANGFTAYRDAFSELTEKARKSNNPDSISINEFVELFRQKFREGNK